MVKSFEESNIDEDVVLLQVPKRDPGKPTEFLTLYWDYMNATNPVTKGVLRDILIGRLEGNNCKAEQ